MTGLRMIAGSGRSGTTWVQDALADANELRPIFEPLHPWVSEVGNRYAHRTLRPGESHPELLQFLTDTCAGRGPQLWARYRRHPNWLFPPVGSLTTREGLGRLYRAWTKFVAEFPTLYRASKRRAPLVKCIRSNLMLGWLSQHCDGRVVLMVRHPGAVIESELRGKWEPERVLDRFRRDAALHELTSNRYRTLLARRLNDVEALAARWVIENQYPILWAAVDDVAIVHYERLKSAPGTEWQRLCSALDLPNVPTVAALAKPSQQSGRSKPESIVEGSTTPRWLQKLTQAQVDAVQRVLDEVGFELYSMRDAAPRAAKLASDTGPVPVFAGVAHS